MGHKRDVIKLKSFTEGLTRRPKSIRNVTMRPVMENNAATMPSHERLSDQNESKGGSIKPSASGWIFSPTRAVTTAFVCACVPGFPYRGVCVRATEEHTHARAGACTTPSPPPRPLASHKTVWRERG